MALYEHVFLARQDVSPQQVEALTETFKGAIEAGGGTVTKSEYWGLKSLAFRIKKNRKAHYTLLHLDTPHAAVAEMERQMSINEDVLRHLTLKVDELEEGPSIMMRSRAGRDDRRGRRDDRRDDRRPPREDRGQDEERRPREDRAQADKPRAEAITEDKPPVEAVAGGTDEDKPPVEAVTGGADEDKPHVEAVTGGADEDKPSGETDAASDGVAAATKDEDA